MIGIIISRLAICRVKKVRSLLVDEMRAIWPVAAIVLIQPALLPLADVAVKGGGTVIVTSYNKAFFVL